MLLDGFLGFGRFWSLVLRVGKTAGGDLSARHFRVWCMLFRSQGFKKFREGVLGFGVFNVGRCVRLLLGLGPSSHC